MLKKILQSAARSLGYEIRRIQPPAPGCDWILDLQRLLRADRAPVIFDVGANIGQTSARLAAAFPAPAALYAFEPAAATFAQLAATALAHPHLHVAQLALGDQPGRLRLHHGLNSQLSRLVPVAALGTGTHEEVEVATLDQTATRLHIDRIDVLKTDTEGYDAAVLRGAAGLLHRGAIRAVLSEVTFETTGAVHTRFDEVRSLLEPHGFCLHNLYECEHWGCRMKYCNALFLLESAFAAPGEPRPSRP